MATERQIDIHNERDEIDDFMLNASQMEFMFRIHNQAESAYQAENWAFFDDVIQTEDWQSLFIDMSWDQAWDCYEIMIGECKDCE